MTERVKFNVEAIPEELKARDQWLMWDADNSRPRRPHWAGDFSVSWNDPDDWGSFDEAVELASQRDSWGIGFVLANGLDDYPRGLYGGLDLDGCAEGRTPKDWLPSLSPFFDDDPYIEWSPSGTGLHIMLAGFEPPEWWTDCIRGDHEGVEAEGAKFFTVTGDQLDGSGDEVGDHGDHVEEWLCDVWEAVRDEPAPPRADDNDGDADGPETATVPSDASGNASDIADAVDRLDAQRVAEKTIVRQWNDSASTSEGVRAFYPSWGSSDCNGTANIVGDDLWTDTGGGGQGGAQVMAAIDMGELSARSASPGDVEGDLWWDTVEHLRDLGFAIPEYEDQKPRSAATEAAESREATDGGAGAGTAPDGDNTAPMTLKDRFAQRVLRPLDPPQDWVGEEITEEVALDRAANILCSEYDFIRPRDDVRGWRDQLYVYDDDLGIYQRHGEWFVEREVERLLGPVANNRRTNEIRKKVIRLSGVRPDTLTEEPHRLCVANGIVDMHTGELDDHTPNEYHRVRLDWEYDPDASCERIDEFLGEIVQTGGDKRTLYQLVAHTLYKEYIAEKAAMLLGDGQNGKSVFLSLVEEFLGEQNVSQRSLQSLDDENFAANDLQGRLANLNPEIGDGGSVSSLNRFKQLTGRDTVTADVKYQKPIKFENHATLLFAANRMPRMSEDTRALWRRWIYINFPFTFDSHDDDAKDEIPKRKLMRELTDPAEMRGLLARAVQEIQRWHETGTLFTDIETPDQVRTKMKRASEPVYDFAMTCLEPANGDDDFLPKEQVRDAYREFAREEDLPTVADNQFGERILNIRDLAVESSQRRVDGSYTTVYNGVRFTSRGRQMLGLDDDDMNQEIDDTQDQHRWERVVEAVRALETAEPVSKSAVVGRLSTEMSLTVAQDAFESAAERGAIYDAGDGWRVS